MTSPGGPAAAVRRGRGRAFRAAWPGPRSVGRGPGRRGREMRDGGAARPYDRDGRRRLARLRGPGPYFPAWSPVVAPTCRRSGAGRVPAR